MFYELTNYQDLFTHKTNDVLQDIIAHIETKLNKYFKEFPFIFYFTAIMDLPIKLNGCKYLVNMFHEKTGYDGSPHLVNGEIETSMNHLQNYYEAQFRNKQSTTSSMPKSLLFSGLLSATKKIKFSHTLNELHYYIECGATPELKANGFENFDILSW